MTITRSKDQSRRVRPENPLSRGHPRQASLIFDSRMNYQVRAMLDERTKIAFFLSSHHYSNSRSEPVRNMPGVPQSFEGGLVGAVINHPGSVLMLRHGLGYQCSSVRCQYMVTCDPKSDTRNLGNAKTYEKL